MEWLLLVFRAGFQRNDNVSLYFECWFCWKW